MIGRPASPSGRFPATSRSSALGADGVTFFVGSIFFTSAATLQYLEVVNTPPAGAGPARTRFVSWEPRRIDWLATSIQLVGTVFFNISTFRAMIEGLDDASANLLSWRPTRSARSASSSRAGSPSPRPGIAGSRGARTISGG